MTPGRRNLLTDVPGVRVGHADDQRLASGVTAICSMTRSLTAIDVRGGGPGTRETDLLDPARTVERIDAITLSGGSALGLDAAGGVQAYLRSIGRGFAIGSARVPLVPAAIMFDLLNGGDKSWDRYPPYRELGYTAAEHATEEFALGSVGAGLGATTVNFKGGVGAASHVLDNGITVGALAMVNAVGSVVVGDGPWFWAAPFERNNEFGGHGFPPTVPAEALEPRTKGAARISTTLVVVATDATFTKAQTRHLAVMAQDGLALAIHPVHTPLDGDVVLRPHRSYVHSIQNPRSRLRPSAMPPPRRSRAPSLAPSMRRRRWRWRGRSPAIEIVIDSRGICHEIVGLSTEMRVVCRAKALGCRGL